MRPAQFTMCRARTVAEAFEAMAVDDAKVIAGGQSLVPMLNFRLARPSTLVDITGLSSLRGVQREGRGVRVGGLTTHAAIEDGAIGGAAGVLLSRMAASLAYRPIRNRGTVGGSLSHADNRAEWPLGMSAVGAQARLISASGSRAVNVADLQLGPFAADVRADELLESLWLPDRHDRVYGYSKISAKVGEFAEAMAVADLGRDAGDQFTCWIGAPASRVISLELPMPRCTADSGWLQEAARNIQAETDPLPAYELNLAAVAAGRAALDALARAGERPEELDREGERRDV